MNDSPSTISPAWPTSWPKDSFTGFWSWAIAIVIAAFFAGVFFFGVGKSGSVSLKDASPFLVIAGILLTAAIEGTLVAILLLAMRPLSKFTLRELGFRVPTPRVLGIAVLGTIAMVVVANGLASLIDLLTHAKHEQGDIELLKALHDPATIAFFAFFAIVCAPIAEETIFRVFFFNFGLRYGGFGAGAILSGVLFGMAHGELFAAIPLALGGVVLCGVYYVTRNAWASMISHGLFNALSIAALLLLPSWVTS